MRIGQILKVRPEYLEEYIRQHTEVWSDVLDAIAQANIRNYSIFHHGDLLFAYFEYVGNDFDSDMKTMASNPRIQDWWELMEPMQRSLPDRADGEWWLTLDEVFHVD